LSGGNLGTEEKERLEGGTDRFAAQYLKAPHDLFWSSGRVPQPIGHNPEKLNGWCTLAVHVDSLGFRTTKTLSPSDEESVRRNHDADRFENG
jgi:hypothetical protein